MLTANPRSSHMNRVTSLILKLLILPLIGVAMAGCITI
jgi:hypothetical protein